MTRTPRDAYREVLRRRDKALADAGRMEATNTKGKTMKNQSTADALALLEAGRPLEVELEKRKLLTKRGWADEKMALTDRGARVLAARREEGLGQSKPWDTPSWRRRRRNDA